jgi:hypothetical protein
MKDVGKYLIQLIDQVDETEINVMSPIHMTAVTVSEVSQLPPAGTGFVICTDQSGLIGLRRRLHGMGIVFCSVPHGSRRNRG